MRVVSIIALMICRMDESQVGVFQIVIGCDESNVQVVTEIYVLKRQVDKFQRRIICSEK